MNVVSIPVADATIDAVEKDGAVWVVVRRVCEALGLDPDSQRVKLQAKPWATTVMITVVDPSGSKRPAFAIRLDSLPMWLATIDHLRVDERVAKRLIQFQREAHDALAQHFGVGCQTPSNAMQTRPSGGVTGSGGIAAPPAKPAGSVLEQLAAVEQMAAMVTGLVSVAREQAAAIDDLRAETKAALEHAQIAQRQADRAIGESIIQREDRRRVKAAVKVITRACQRHCTHTGKDYRRFYGDLRDALGLRRRRDGHSAPPLSEAVKTGSQVLVLAREATNKGVPGVTIASIESILRGDDDAARAGAIDMPTTAVH